MIVNNFTSINKMNNHLSPHIIKHVKDHGIWHCQLFFWLQHLNGKLVNIKTIYDIISGVYYTTFLHVYILFQGMSEQECNELEKEEIKQEEEEERKRRRNILLDLDNRCEKVIL